MIIERKLYTDFKEHSIQGRYVTNSQVGHFLKRLNDNFVREDIGTSVQNRVIKSIEIGTGSYKILMWSQMHGNESTTTKAVLDLINFLSTDHPLSQLIGKECTLKIIPILNPDGAQAYTRVNANGIDLNRDAQDLSQPESVALRNVYNAFQPNFCFNLHDQRTIFNVGGTNKPATVSFLAPSHDDERSISKTRGISMQLIAAMNTELQERIPGQVGRYDDGFNANCVGDTFQMLGTPTILFEAGHYHLDYQRETTRAYIFHAIVSGITCIASNEIEKYGQDSYFSIPENQKMFFDVLIKNAHLVNDVFTNSVGILFSEVLKEKEIFFEPKIADQGVLENYFGHVTYDCSLNKDLEIMKTKNFWKLLQR